MNDESRTARISRDAEGYPVGCAIFLTVGQLCELGLNPKTTGRIEYIVIDGDLQLRRYHPPDGQRTQKNPKTINKSRGGATDD